MATEAGFPGNPFQETEGIKRRSSNVNKRKRESIDVGPAATRNAPNTRRASSQYAAAAAQLADNSPDADESTIADLAGESFEHSAANGNTEDPNAQFDFALQPSTSETPMAQPATGSDATGGVNVDTAAAALSQHYSMTEPRNPPPELTTQATAESDQGFNLEGSAEYQGGESGSATELNMPSLLSRYKRAPVGSEAWHKVRKDNHKEVERRRRETINEGITELSQIVPGCEKNKGAVLQRAVQYIQKLHEEASQNIDKWTFEKLVTEQAINELSAKLSRAWAEKEEWKRLAREAGVDVEAVDLGAGGAAGAEGSAAVVQGGVASGAGEGEEAAVAAAAAASVAEEDVKEGESA